MKKSGNNRIKSFGKAAIVACFLCGISSCATITTGTTQTITVTTEKDVHDAHCELTDKKGGQWHVPSTPGTASVRKGDGPMSVVCKKEGYKPAVLSVDETIVGATFGNIILGGGIGILVDAASGAAQQYPDNVIMWMEPEEWSSVEEKLAWQKDKAAFEESVAEKKKAQQPETTIE
jgi:hypothetical protein